MKTIKKIYKRMMAGWGRSGRIIIEFDPKKNCFISDPTLKNPQRIWYVILRVSLFYIFCFFVKSYSWIIDCTTDRFGLRWGFAFVTYNQCRHHFVICFDFDWCVSSHASFTNRHCRIKASSYIRSN